jgi:methylated-DNA-[protein]-cysteine S-methyltransferase
MSSDGKNLTGLWIEGQRYFLKGIDANAARAAATGTKELPIFESAKKWLSIYFGGKNPDFTPPLAPEGSDFRRAVWNILRSIPYGKTVSYKDVATMLAKQSGEYKATKTSEQAVARTPQTEARASTRISAQAVGGAVGHNPISIIIPCHRVIGSDGGLVGYAAGLDIKAKLLTLENAAL